MVSHAVSNRTDWASMWPRGDTSPAAATPVPATQAGANARARGVGGWGGGAGACPVGAALGCGCGGLGGCVGGHSASVDRLASRAYAAVSHRAVWASMSAGGDTRAAAASRVPGTRAVARARAGSGAVGGVWITVSFAF